VVGTAGLPDQPLAVRRAQAAEVVRLLSLLEVALAERPEDLEGHGQLARQVATLGRWQEALAAQERVVAILGDGVTAADLVDLAETRIITAGGIVTTAAQAEIERALGLDPQNPAGRYYLALGQLQRGRADLAFGTWAALVEAGPPDAPWVAPARAGMAEAARAAAAPAGAGPSAADVEAAAEMPEADRAAMIEGMVDGLAARLAAEGGPPEDWAQLVRALGVLGRGDEAAAILAEARQAFAGDAGAQAALDAAAAAAGLSP
jgi:cytochrome c-type biogenesis protein CcmH